MTDENSMPAAVVGTALRAPGAEGLALRGFRRVCPPAPRRAVAGGTWLVIPDRNGVLDVVAEQLRGSRARVVRVPPPAATGGYGQFFASALGPAERVGGVVFGGLLGDEVEGDGQCPMQIMAGLERALADRGDRSVPMVAVASGVIDATGSEPIAPWKATLATWASSGRRGSRRLLDLSLPATTGPARRLVAAVLAEIDGETEEPVVALRGGHRFVPTLEPVPAVRSGGASVRHTGERYAVVGDGPLTELFRRALCAAGATVSDLCSTAPVPPGTALILLDASSPVDSAVSALVSAVSTVEQADAGACEVHVVCDQDTEAAEVPLVSLVESHVALLRRESGIPWTTVVWPRLDHAAVHRAVPRVVGAVPGGSLLVVAPPAGES